MDTRMKVGQRGPAARTIADEGRIIASFKCDDPLAWQHPFELATMPTKKTITEYGKVPKVITLFYNHLKAAGIPCLIKQTGVYVSVWRNYQSLCLDEFHAIGWSVVETIYDVHGAE